MGKALFHFAKETMGAGAVDGRSNPGQRLFTLMKVKNFISVGKRDLKRRNYKRRQKPMSSAAMGTVDSAKLESNLKRAEIDLPETGVMKVKMTGAVGAAGT